jgi:hypothetical protein
MHRVLCSSAYMYAGRDRRLALRSLEVLNIRWSEEAQVNQLNQVVNEDGFEMYRGMKWVCFTGNNTFGCLY